MYFLRHVENADSQRSFLIVCFTGGLLPLLVQLFLIRRYVDFPPVVDHLKVFLQPFQEEWFKGSSNTKFRLSSVNQCGALLQAIYYNTLAMIVMFAAASWIIPGDPVFPTSLAKEPENLSWFIYFAQILWLLYTLISMMGVLDSVLFVFVVWGFSGPDILGELVYEPRKQRNNHRNFNSFSRDFRKFTIFGKIVENFYGPVIIPSLQGCLTVVVIYASYGAIRRVGILSVILSVLSFTALICLLVTFILLGRFDQQSLEVLSSWKICCFRREFTKTLESFLPIQIHVGQFYFVDRGLVLTMISIMLQCIINLLIVQ
ncbi:unnamed protein product [Allacma fusca]|uniref:Uncharacterized protein n=1 Tax=Allacma fusca TaxID=39272 RepID=A0A8J2JJI5_9HEXA|nr:unnamed protein product [Allacma fusca]